MLDNLFVIRNVLYFLLWAGSSPLLESMPPAIIYIQTPQSNTLQHLLRIAYLHLYFFYFLFLFLAQWICFDNALIFSKRRKFNEFSMIPIEAKKMPIKNKLDAIIA